MKFPAGLYNNLPCRLNRCSSKRCWSMGDNTDRFTHWVI